MQPNKFSRLAVKIFLLAAGVAAGTVAAHYATTGEIAWSRLISSVLLLTIGIGWARFLRASAQNADRDATTAS